MSANKLNKATEAVSISMPGWLIDEIDRVCDELDFTRSNLVCRAVRKYLLMKMDSPRFWGTFSQNGKDPSC